MFFVSRYSLEEWVRQSNCLGGKKMADKRIYSVMDSEGGETLVLAVSPAQAIRHVSQNRYQAKAATAIQVAAFFQAGGKVIEEAGEDVSE